MADHRDGRIDIMCARRKVPNGIDRDSASAAVMQEEQMGSGWNCLRMVFFPIADNQVDIEVAVEKGLRETEKGMLDTALGQAIDERAILGRCLDMTVQD
jgi:hypothetical protein